MPISMALTEWHFVLLYEDKVRVIGLLSDKVVFEEQLDLVSPFYLIASMSFSYGKADWGLGMEQPPGVRPLRLATDSMRKTCWMYTDQAIYEIVIKDEDRDVWKIYLARSNWDLARRYAKVRSLPPLSPFLPHFH